MWIYSIVIDGAFSDYFNVDRPIEVIPLPFLPCSSSGVL